MPDNRKKYTELQKEIKSLRLRIAELEGYKLQRERAQEALRKNEEKFRTFMESATDLMAIVDKDRNFTYVNESMASTLGYSKEEMIGMHVTQVLSEGDLEKKFESKSEELIAKGEINLEATWVTRDGEKIHGELKIVAVYDSEGKYAGSRSVFHNITEQKKTQEALQKSKLLYRTLMENIHLAITFIDTNHRIVMTNVGLGKFFRKSPSEIIGKYCFREFEKRNAVCSHCPGTRAMATGRAAEVETEGVRDDGSRFSVRIHAFPVFEVDGVVKGFIEVVEDITERRQAEEKLKESEQRFKTIFDNAADGILLVDVENKKFYIGNKVICQMLGYKPEEIKNLTVSDIHPEEHLSYVMEQFGKQARKEATLAEDIPVKRKDGSIFYADVNSFPITLAGKTYLMGIFRDITEHKKAEEELNIYHEKMARTERLASLGTLSATLVHELTQPLTVIRLSIENSLEDLEATSSPKAVIEGLTDSLNGVSNVTSVIDRFRNFARQSSKKALSETDLSTIADRTVQLLGRAAQRAKITLCLKDVDKLPPVYSNEKDLEQLFFALIQNAIQAAGGKEACQLTITGTVKDENIELRFSDNCSGIASENLDKIFDPFFTTGSDDARTGLGLSIVQQIVSGYGGKIRVQSQFGKGATFYVTLPIHPEIVE